MRACPLRIETAFFERLALGIGNLCFLLPPQSGASHAWCISNHRYTRGGPGGGKLNLVKPPINICSKLRETSPLAVAEGGESISAGHLGSTLQLTLLNWQQSTPTTSAIGVIRHILGPFCRFPGTKGGVCRKRKETDKQTESPGHATSGPGTAILLDSLPLGTGRLPALLFLTLREE